MPLLFPQVISILLSTHFLSKTPLLFPLPNLTSPRPTETLQHVKTAIPVDGRFDQVVLSCNATSDHGLLWIEREAQKALDLMKEDAEAQTPSQLRMERTQTLQKEHRDALERAVSLNVPHAIPPAEESTTLVASCVHAENADETSNSTSGLKSGGKTDWNDLAERLFGGFHSNKDISKSDPEQ